MANMQQQLRMPVAPGSSSPIVSGGGRASGEMQGGLVLQGGQVAQQQQQQQMLQQQQQQQQQGHHIKKGNSRYKTELCRAFQEKGFCKYSDKCQFAHGHGELRQMQRHPKYKTEMCRTFHNTGLCPYGPRCHFIHEGGQAQGSVSSSSSTHSISSPSPTQRQMSNASPTHSPPSAGPDSGALGMGYSTTLVKQTSNSSLSVSYEVTEAFPHESDNIPVSPYRPSVSSSPDSRMSMSPIAMGRMDVGSPGGLYQGGGSTNDMWSPSMQRVSRHGSSGGSPELPAYVPDVVPYGQDPSFLYVPAMSHTAHIRASPGDMYAAQQQQQHALQQQQQQQQHQQLAQQQQQQQQYMFKFPAAHMDHTWERGAAASPYDLSTLDPPSMVKARVISPQVPNHVQQQAPVFHQQVQQHGHGHIAHHAHVLQAQQHQQNHMAFLQHQQMLAQGHIIPPQAQMHQQHQPHMQQLQQLQQPQHGMQLLSGSGSQDSLDAAARRLPVFSAMGNI